MEKNLQEKLKKVRQKDIFCVAYKHVIAAPCVRNALL